MQNQNMTRASHRPSHEIKINVKELRQSDRDIPSVDTDQTGASQYRKVEATLECIVASMHLHTPLHCNYSRRRHIRVVLFAHTTTSQHQLNLMGDEAFTFFRSQRLTNETDFSASRQPQIVASSLLISNSFDDCQRWKWHLMMNHTA